MATITQCSSDFNRGISPSVAPSQYGGHGNIGGMYISNVPISSGGGKAVVKPPMMGPSALPQYQPTPGTGGGTFTQPSYPGIQMATHYPGLYISPVGAVGSYSGGGGQPPPDLTHGRGGAVFVSNRHEDYNYPQNLGNPTGPGGVFVSDQHGGLWQSPHGQPGAFNAGGANPPKDIQHVFVSSQPTDKLGKAKYVHRGSVTTGVGGTYFTSTQPVAHYVHRGTQSANPNDGIYFTSGHGVPGVGGEWPQREGTQHVGTGPGSTYFVSDQHGGLSVPMSPYQPGAPQGAYRSGGGNPNPTITKTFVSAQPTTIPKMPVAKQPPTHHSKFIHTGNQHVGKGGIYFTSGHGNVSQLPGQGGTWPMHEGTVRQPGGMFVSKWPDDLVGYRHNAPVRVGDGNVYSLGSYNPSIAHGDQPFHVPHIGTETGVYGVSGGPNIRVADISSNEWLFIGALSATLFAAGAFAAAYSLSKKPHRALVGEGVKHIRGIRGLTASQRAAEQEEAEDTRGSSGLLGALAR